MILNLIKVSHPILLVVFFVILRYNDNQDELIINDLVYVFSIILPITIVFTLIMRFLIKNTTKSIIISSFTILVFFVYIPIHNLLFQFQKDLATIYQSQIIYLTCYYRLLHLKHQIFYYNFFY